ncbi:MAG: hypothetical protein H0W30_10200 [Gemmatimonadaceae bacterium]|nr:hypothetical protein [Gemmatimonadaceae bacterium]MDQ3519152.1 DUF1801 domain-containing protein [Gemmatimonadota bacterium]
MPKSDHETTFQQLRSILQRYEPHLVAVNDKPGNYYLDTSHIQPNKKPLFFGSARIGKQYVSFHLMPVYVWPDLLDGASEDLRRRMQGKSCFNFKKPEPDLLTELAVLTDRGFERCREHGYAR